MENAVQNPRPLTTSPAWTKMPLLEAKVCLVLIVVVVLAVRISLTSRRLEANAAAIKPSLSSSSFDAATEPPLVSLASDELDDFFSDTVTATDVTSHDLEYNFYGNTCPRAKKIVRTKMAWIYNQHRDVAAQPLCLFFHVCFIEIEAEGRSRPMVKLLCVCIVIAALFSNGVVAFFLDSHEGDPKTEIINNTLMVSLTLIQGADSKGAVCLDGTLPGYYFHRGHGSGKKSWLVHFQIIFVMAERNIRCPFHIRIDLNSSGPWGSRHL